MTRRHSVARSEGAGHRSKMLAVEGASVTLSASRTSVQGVAGTATRHVRIDTTPPRVQVTGVRNGQVYPLGGVPAPGCTTTDSVSGATTAAKVTVTGTSSHLPGRRYLRLECQDRALPVRGQSAVRDQDRQIGRLRDHRRGTSRGRLRSGPRQRERQSIRKPSFR